MLSHSLYTLSSLICCCSTQALISPQKNTFNSSFALTDSQIQAAGIDTTTANNVEVAINFERSNWATGSVQSDNFYQVPPDSSAVSPGSLLKVEEYTDTSLFTISPTLALSRIIFQSRTFNASAVPASAYILWPWMPRNVTTGFPVVAWAHGTSGMFGECGPSHIRNLWYQYSAPYILALQGYVVVAPDYAGLGLNRDAKGGLIKHQYLAHQAAANDLFYAVEAAQKAFPALSKEFVVMGHSQGGAAAFAAAQRQATEPVDGYLGAIAGSPASNSTTLASSIDIAWALAQMLSTIFPDFELSDWLTDSGIQKLNLAKELGGCNSATLATLFATNDTISKLNWTATSSFQRFNKVTRIAGKHISGPMLVLQGTKDPLVNYSSTDFTVQETCAAFPDSQIQYARFEGVSHVPVLNSGQRIWLNWIADRFAGVKASKGCQTVTYEAARASASYQYDSSFYLEYATEAYELA